MRKQCFFFAEEAWKDEQLKEPEWRPVEGVGTQGRREVTKGVVGLLHSLDLKKRTCRIPKKLLHIERFSASCCIFLPFSQPSNSTDSWASAQPVAGRVTGCENHGLNQNHAAAHRRKKRHVDEPQSCQTFRLSIVAIRDTVATSSSAVALARKTQSMLL